MTGPMPLIPTTVCGSHALPSWLHLVREAVAADRLGPVDLREAYDDAVRLAMRDQVEAGVAGRMAVLELLLGAPGAGTGIAGASAAGAS